MQLQLYFSNEEKKINVQNVLNYYKVIIQFNVEIK